MADTAILNYSEEVVDNVREILWKVREHGGLFSSKFAIAEAQRLQGRWGVDTVNIACMIVRGAQMFPGQGKASDAQLEVLVEKVRKCEPVLIHQIAQLRAEQGKK